MLDHVKYSCILKNVVPVTLAAQPWSLRNGSSPPYLLVSLVVAPHYLGQLECAQQSNFQVACGAPLIFASVPWVGGGEQHPAEPPLIHLHHGNSPRATSGGRPIWSSLSWTMGFWCDRQVIKVRRLVLYSPLISSGPHFGLSNLLVGPTDKCFPVTPFILSHLFFCRITCHHPGSTLFQSTLSSGYSP